jgi:hypothetical protein
MKLTLGQFVNGILITKSDTWSDSIIYIYIYTVLIRVTGDYKINLLALSLDIL